MKVIASILTLFLFINTISGQFPSEKINTNPELKKYEEDLRYYTEYINSGQKDRIHYIYYHRAYSHYKLNNFNRAIRDVEKALTIEKKHQDYTFIKGNSYWLLYSINSKKDKDGNHIKYLKKATKYLNTSLLYSTLGYAQCASKRYKSALKNLNIAIELAPENPAAYNNRALTYLGMNKVNLALADVNKSIKMYGENPYAYKNRALISIALKDYDAACTDIKKAETLEVKGRMSGTDLDELEEIREKACKYELIRK